MATPASFFRPSTLTFEVTQRCNHTCRHCYNVWSVGGTYPSGELDTEQTLILLEKALGESGCRHVTLTGGEPLLRSDLPQIVTFLKEYGVVVNLITNGRLLTESTAIDLIERGVAFFELPLLSNRPEVHDFMSGAPGAWQAALAAMTHLRYHGGWFAAVFVATRLNLPDLEETLKLAFAFGAKGVMINRFNPGGRGLTHINEYLPSPDQLRQGLEIAEKTSRELSLPISCSIPIQPCLVDLSVFPSIIFGFCAAGTSRAYPCLDPLGNLRPCNHSPTILGNIFESNFKELLTSAEMINFTRAVPYSCEGCSHRSECQGGCKAAAQTCYDSPWQEEPFLRQTGSQIMKREMGGRLFG